MASYWERGRMREVDDEDGSGGDAGGHLQLQTPWAKCEVLMWHQQRRNVGKGPQKRQEAKRRFIFINKI